MAQLLSLNVGIPRDVSWRGEIVHTSVWKEPVQGRRLVRRLNVEGDGHSRPSGKDRLGIADDHELIRRGVRSLLEAEAGWKVVAEASDGQDAIEKAKETRPDIVVLDIAMPRLSGLEAARRLNRLLPQVKVLMLTMHESERLAWEVLDAGARGYVTKSDTSRDLVIEALRREKTFFTPRVDRLILDSFLDGSPAKRVKEMCGDQLTSRQREIVQLLAEGKTSKEVSTLLNLSVKTVETHRANIMRRLRCHCVSDLVRYAVRNNIVQP